ncbi:phage C1 repressor [Alkalidesulfovibrio alkalitolerans DSM 16529]|uniref:Phage C1 repressor n=1 Tax=Alkalidesulfovibrio alkalitolerans DSM 16529 TaxID=1121439 RepID=S7TEZ6_9BACT|nr:S24 family peptidase [Alkalidesulfovibrio alkalitolerans]EPR35747.1 phage C1 repressor [Alkalidesulfovibrio alkalitolerans DSM 16529]
MSATAFERFFARVCKAAGIESQQELARLLGVNRSAVTQAKRRGVVPAAWPDRLARHYGYDAQWLETGEASFRNRTACQEAEVSRAFSEDEFSAVPKVRARLCAGGGSFESGAEVEEYYAFRRQWLSRKGRADSMVLMDIFGNSMEPEIREGDTALIDQSQQNVIAGGIYAVGLEDTVMVKRVEKRPGALVLLSDNRDYSPIVLQGEEISQARVIGKVVWIGREYR